MVYTGGMTEQPVACIESTPTKASIHFGGQWINLSKIARAQGLSPSYLSRIFAGNRRPGLDHTIKIAAALGMGLESFLEALDARVREIKEKEQAILQAHYDRARREDRNDMDAIRRGQVPPPRLPALRA